MKFVDKGKEPQRRRILHVDLREDSQSEPRSALVEDLERFDRSTSAGAERAAKAVLRGVRRYRKERLSESNTKSGGWSRAPLHMARSMVTGLEAMKGLREDAEDAISAPRLRKQLKKRLRS